MPHALLWLLALAAAHVVVRVALSSSLKWDEAEQILWSQQLALGYGAQPPLYTWLQWVVNQIVGPGVLALALLKQTLLALAYVLMYFAGRELLGPRGAWWAAASMLLLPPLGWYSVRDQTHTVLVTTLICAAWWLLLHCVRRPRPAAFAAFGLVCGLGLLAKYNFALALAAMVLAVLATPHARRALLRRGWWLAPLVCMLVCLPHAVWLLGHVQQASASTLQRMQLDAVPRWHGLRSLAEGLLGTLGLWTLAVLWTFRGGWRGAQPLPQARAWAPQLFARYLVLVLLALLSMVLAVGVTSFKSRWLLPLLCVTPLAAFAARPALQLSPRGGRYTTLVMVLALLILLAASLRPWRSGQRGHTDGLNHPTAQLAAALHAAGYDGHGYIIAADPMLAASLHLFFPQAPAEACWPSELTDEAAAEEAAHGARKAAHAGASPISTCVAEHMAAAAHTGRGWLLVSRDGNLRPDWWAQATVSVPGQTVHGVRLPYLRMRPDAPPAHYQYVWQPPATAMP